MPLVGLALAGVFLSLGARTTNAMSAAVSLALSTALVLCVEGPFWSTMTEIAGGRSGLAGGIMNTGCNVGGLISPVLTPVLAAAIGWETALHVAAALSVVAAVLWLGIEPQPPGVGPSLVGPGPPPHPRHAGPASRPGDVRRAA